jgi:FkbM family methyltransferase
LFVIEPILKDRARRRRPILYNGGGAGRRSLLLAETARPATISELPVSTSGIRRLVLSTLRALGWEVQRVRHSHTERQVLKNLLLLSGADIVLDVGANIGQFGDMLFGLGFKGRLVSFEALPDIHRQLTEHARTAGAAWQVAPCAALGSARGKVEMNVAANLVSSSILPMRQDHVDAAPDSKYITRTLVDIQRLDELASRYVTPDADLLIKIDTQGYEREVLEGATALLPQTVALQIELSLVSLYEGAPDFVDMLGRVLAQGFELFGLVPGFRDPRSGRLLQMDGFFLRTRPG